MSGSEVSGVEVFEAERARLTGLAYRMLGSISDAEDVVSEAWLRYQEECAVEECVVMETLACQPDEGGPPPTARCVAERCVLR